MIEAIYLQPTKASKFFELFCFLLLMAFISLSLTFVNLTPSQGGDPIVTGTDSCMWNHYCIKGVGTSIDLVKYIMIVLPFDASFKLKRVLKVIVY